jgi:putative LysE/RhtB family amino acid efflux pump
MRLELLPMLKVVLKSFMVGALGACAMGPIFLIVLNRALDKGFWGGFASAIGVATADGIFFTLGLAGSLSTAEHSIAIVRGFEGFGGLMLVVFGLSTILGLKTYLTYDHAAELEPKILQKKLFKTGPNFFWLSLSSFFLNISNPMTLIFFATMAVKAFPELARAQLAWVNVLYAATACMVGSLFSFTLVSAFASLIAKLLVKRFRIILEGATATIFLAIGLYLVAGFLKFIVKTGL